MTYSLEIKNISYSYKDKLVLDDVSFNVRNGEFVGIIGPNGSGKSTLIKIIVGILKPFKGEVLVFGEDIADFKKKYMLGYVAQHVSYFNQGFPATVYEVVSLGLICKKRFKRIAKDEVPKIDEAIEKVGLSSFKNVNLNKLSLGQRQRVFIARALVTNPKMFILDEPTVGVDLNSVRSFFDLLKELQTQGCTIILVTHDIGVVTTCIQRIICLNKRLFFCGLSEEFVENKKDILNKLYNNKDIQIIDHGH